MTTRTRFVLSTVMLTVNIPKITTPRKTSRKTEFGYHSFFDGHQEPRDSDKPQ